MVITLLIVTTSTHSDSAIAWSSQLLYDFVVFLLTLMRSLHTGKVWHRSIANILLRDGVSVKLYFPL